VLFASSAGVNVSQETRRWAPARYSRAFMVLLSS
jgi:hypothetical protein